VAGQLGPIAAAKTALRREILAARDALPTTARIAASSHITQQIVALDAWKNARVVLAYLSFGS
jgi:5-formyltetrahydrofolate cyclo-ligase